MIDLHVHVLPGLDDGPESVSESIEMCRMALSDGVKTVVATPHMRAGCYDNDRDKVLEAVDKLRVILKENRISLTVLAGSDVHIDRDLAKLIEKRVALTVNDNMRHIMIELPSEVVPPNLWEWTFRMARAGFTPILTHPERNIATHRSMDVVREWVRRGGLVQVTAMSLTGEFGKEIRKCAEELIKARLVQVIASDGHSATTRPPVLSGAVKAAASLIGKDNALKLVQEYPAAIIAGKTVNAPEPVSRGKNSLFRMMGGL